jgi:AcrR family transcriptional regulator
LLNDFGFVAVVIPAEATHQSNDVLLVPRRCSDGQTKLACPNDTVNTEIVSYAMKRTKPQPKKSPRPKTPEAGPEAALSRRIIATARRHFFAHGFRAITTDDLAAELALSKKTLYALFPSKEALLEAVVLQKFASLEAEVARISDHRSLDCMEKLLGLLACLQHEMEEIQPPFVRDMQRGAPEVFALIEQRREDIICEHFGALFEESRQAGMIRKEVSTTLLVAVILGAVHAVLNPNKLAELRLQPREGLRSILQIILEGAMTEKGRGKL